jgi:hypothetical protein
MQFINVYGPGPFGGQKRFKTIDESTKVYKSTESTKARTLADQRTVLQNLFRRRREMNTGSRKIKEAKAKIADKQAIRDMVALSLKNVQKGKDPGVSPQKTNKFGPSIYLNLSIKDLKNVARKAFEEVVQDFHETVHKIRTDPLQIGREAIVLAQQEFMAHMMSTGIDILSLTVYQHILKFGEKNTGRFMHVVLTRTIHAMESVIRENPDMKDYEFIENIGVLDLPKLVQLLKRYAEMNEKYKRGT